MPGTPLSEALGVALAISCLFPRVGGTEASANFLIRCISDLAKVSVRSVHSCSYLTGVAAAWLRQHLSNINKICNW